MGYAAAAWLIRQAASLPCRVKAEGSLEWLLDTRGAEGQALPLELETGMGEMPEVGQGAAQCMAQGGGDNWRRLAQRLLCAQLGCCLVHQVLTCRCCPRFCHAHIQALVPTPRAQALDMCVRLMLRGEVAALTAAWSHAYDGRDDAPQAGLQAGCGVGRACAWPAAPQPHG